MHTWFYWSNMPCQKEVRFEDPIGAAGKSEKLTVSVFASALKLTTLFQRSFCLCLYSYIARLPRSSIRGKLGVATQDRKKKRPLISNEVTRHGVAWNSRPTQCTIYVPLQVNRFQKFILVIVQYKYLKSCSADFILQNLILRTKPCGTGFIIQLGLSFPPDHHGRVEMLCTTVVPAPKGHLGGASP